VDLINECVKNLDNVVVSTYELEQTGTSFSYQTVERYYSPDDELYFAIGSDGLNSLDRWKEPEILAQKCKFYLIERPYYPINQADLEKMRKIYRIELADFIGGEGSSTLLKVAVAFDRAEEVVPKVVADYIERNSLYQNYRYITSRYDEFDLTQKRREHIYRTTKCAVILASKNGADVDKVIRASLLHDIAKYLTEEKLVALGVGLSEKAKALPISCIHQQSGREVAEKLLGETDIEVLSAIETHTTGQINMSVYQKIVYCADYIEEGRDFKGVDRIRKIVYDDLNLGTLAVMENTINYLRETGRECSSKTVDAYEYLKKELKK
ncbi:MAG: bis(5'-nucleosyl)-tetraphosphatase (symmetrical) YqeK, partial [Clostridia bacterium]|nr:bis(5'-nucleosyl)-tetraphosphatase (symmetrical) YqeK [Clostridia bacterium]